MKPQFARNPTDAMQCFADFLAHTNIDRTNPVHTRVVHEVPIYFISGTMGQTLATISRTFPLNAAMPDDMDCGFLVFERPTLFVSEQDEQFAPSGLHWAPIENGGVTPFWWEPPNFYRFGDSHKEEGAKWIGALAALLRQKLATVTRPRMGKHVIKRLKLKAGAPECRVVLLRERAYHSQSVIPSVVEWSCRWLVRGHWRVIESGPTWVTAHVKGPASKPMKAPSERIFAVVR